MSLDQEAKSLVRGLPQSHLSFASQGKSMVCKVSKGRLKAGAQPKDQDTRSTFPPPLSEKQRGVCCGLTALMSKLLSATAHRAHELDIGRLASKAFLQL